MHLSSGSVGAWKEKCTLILMQLYVQFAAFYKKNVEDFEPLAAVVIPDSKPAHLGYSFLPLLKSRLMVSSCEVRVDSGCFLNTNL